MSHKCINHPRYMVKRAPKCDCDICWKLWISKKIREIKKD